MDKQLRYLTKSCRYTKWQRARLWWINVRSAIRETPPETYLEWFQVSEGDPGWEEAAWSFNIVENPLRYRIENGEWVQVYETSAK